MEDLDFQERGLHSKSCSLTSHRLARLSTAQVDVTIPPVYKDTRPKNDFSGCCNVRIYCARFGIAGLVAKSKTAHVTVRLRHSGKETIVDRHNAAHAFVHDPVETVYSFNGTLACCRYRRNPSSLSSRNSKLCPTFPARAVRPTRCM